VARTPSKLAEYRRKRNFSKTAEPAGAAPRATRARPLRFVVQKHDASRLHFDLRLELDGVMKSWAVPKGPSTDPAQRRLAMHVEDHPMEYNSFEGIIPAGEYGGGTVMLWDRGTYVPNGDDAADGVDAVRRGYRKGRLKIAFRGKRLRGGYVLVRIRNRDDDDQRSWLLIKERDEHADPDRDLVQEETTSIATRRSMEQIASGRSRRWSSNRNRTDETAGTGRAANREKDGGRRAKKGAQRTKRGSRRA
jgi:bifunctional non-homologous end joining protein LigD